MAWTKICSQSQETSRTQSFCTLGQAVFDNVARLRKIRCALQKCWNWEMWRACEHFHIVPAVHAAQHAWEPVWLHGVDITLGTAKANPTNMTMIPRIDKCSPVPKPRHQVQVVGVSFLDMATCEVCGDGFADDAEKHLCSPSRAETLARTCATRIACSNTD